ncbi:hypothetical protein CPB85DRAFT_296866 [Mucidula mucida]|nr:hypothetical protein CPB85DRAFT_296866 [Mucidula mucida]
MNSVSLLSVSNRAFAPLLVNALLPLIRLLLFYRRYPAHETCAPVGVYSRRCQLPSRMGVGQTMTTPTHFRTWSIMASISIMTAVVDVIVILKEYDPFHRILERDGKRAFIVSSWYWQINLSDIPSPPSPRVETPHSMSTLK